VTARPLRVALLDHGHDHLVAELAGALRDAGHRPSVLSVPPWRVPEALLRKRGFTGPLTPLPVTLAALSRGGYDVAHAFSAPDAAAALAWRRLVRRPVVFTCPEVLGREHVADRRLRLELLSRAVGDSDAVTAPSSASRDALWRWLAVDATLLEPSDAAGHERLYRELIEAAP